VEQTGNKKVGELEVGKDSLIRLSPDQENKIEKLSKD